MSTTHAYRVTLLLTLVGVFMVDGLSTESVQIAFAKLVFHLLLCALAGAAALEWAGFMEWLRRKHGNPADGDKP